MQCRLCSNDDDTKALKSIQEQLKDTEKRLAEGRAVLLHLQTQLTNAACDDPWAAIGAQLALPILQVGHVPRAEQRCGRLDSACPLRYLKGLVARTSYPGLSASHSSCTAGLI